MSYEKRQAELERIQELSQDMQQLARDLQEAKTDREASRILGIMKIKAKEANLLSKGIESDPES